MSLYILTAAVFFILGGLLQLANIHYINAREAMFLRRVMLRHRIMEPYPQPSPQERRMRELERLYVLHEDRTSLTKRGTEIN